MNPPFLTLLQESFAKHASRPALVHAGRSWTYAELQEFVWTMAGCLQVIPLSKGDRVALCTGHKFAFLGAYLATLFAGGVPFL